MHDYGNDANSTNALTTVLDAKPTFRTLITAFTDFLTVAIHTILYERSIYPQTSFISARKYNFAVRQSRHPKVCTWINDAVCSVEAELLKCTVQRIAVALHDDNNVVLERYVFDVSRLPIVAQSGIDLPMNASGSDGERIPALPNVDVEEEFRALMSQLTTCTAALQPLPHGCSFTVAIELKKTGTAPLGYPQPWVPAPDPGSTTEQAVQHKIKPLRKASAGAMVFETWIERTSIE